MMDEIDLKPKKPFKKTADQTKAVGLQCSDANHILLFGGSRSGKTFINIRSMIIRASQCESRHCILRKRFNAVKKSIWYDTLPKVLELCFPKLPVEKNNSDFFIRLPNKSEIWLGGLDDKERVDKILGNEYSTIFFNECSEISYDAICTALTRLAQKTDLRNKAYYDCNPPTKSHWSYKLFVQKLDPITKTATKFPGDYVCMLMNPDGNAENLPPGYVEKTLEGLPSRMKLRFKHGMFLDDLVGALWTRSMIDDHRVVNPPDPKSIVRVVVGVDPAVSSVDTSALTGITAACKTRNGHVYIMDSEGVKESPLEWAREAIRIYDKHMADLMVGEVNNGGDLVEANIRAVRANISYKAVRASRGKIVRAEPIANMYEQGKVHHVGEFAELEDQQCSYCPELSVESPDIMDSCVWAVTELAGQSLFAGTW